MSDPEGSASFARVDPSPAVELLSAGGRCPDAVVDVLRRRIVSLRPILPVATAAVPAWATVELDRAARELASPMPGAEVVGARDEPHLGARARLVLAPAAIPTLVLLEPSTEGRLAAALARFDEGCVGAYLLLPPAALDRLRDGARRLGIPLSPVDEGPLGRSVLVLGGPPFGPHLLLAEPAPRDAAAGFEAGTIGTR